MTQLCVPRGPGDTWGGSQHWDHKQRLSGRHRRTHKQTKHRDCLCVSIGCERWSPSSGNREGAAGCQQKKKKIDPSYEEKASRTITSRGQRQSPGTKPTGSLRVIGKDREGEGAGRSLRHMVVGGNTENINPTRQGGIRITSAAPSGHMARMRSCPSPAHQVCNLQRGHF